MASEKRLIDANALLEAIKFEHDCIMQDPEVSKKMKWCEAVCNHRVTEAIERSPTVDAVEVVHGEWIMCLNEDDCEYIECPLCGEQFYDGDNDTFDKPYNYCPNCGAKMDGDGDGT